MQILGLLLAGAGLLLLVMTQWLKPSLPKGLRRSRGIILNVAPPQGRTTCIITVRYTAGNDTHTATFPAAPENHFFPGQQVVVEYKTESPANIEQALSFSTAWGKQFLGILLASLLLVAGLMLIRMA